MGLSFKKATKESARLRAALIGPSGSGKTYTALAIGSKLGNKVAVIDTERGSASKYADDFEFDVLELESFEPDTYVQAIKAAADAGYDVLVIDSLSHAWSGKGGALEQVDNVSKRTRAGSSFGAWREVTPMHNRMVDAILRSPMHVVVTMRAKTEFVQERDPKTGKTIVRKVGMAPVQRDGVEYEFDVVADIDAEHNFIVSKTRCKALTDQVFHKAGDDVASILRAWLGDGPVIDRPAPKPAPKPQPVKAQPPSEPPSEPCHDDDAPGLFDATKDRIAACNDSGELATISGDLKAIQSGKMVGRHEMEALVKLYNEAKARLESAE